MQSGRGGAQKRKLRLEKNSHRWIVTQDDQWNQEQIYLINFNLLLFSAVKFDLCRLMELNGIFQIIILYFFHFYMYVCRKNIRNDVYMIFTC